MKRSLVKAWEAWRRAPRWRWAVPALVLAALAWWLSGGSTPATRAVTFAVRRGPLEITVTEGGSVQALESQEIKCEVRVGYQGVKILKIVDEGYQVTEEDVRTNKVLVELDSSEIENELVEQEIRYQSAASSLAEAGQAYQIQINQNLADVKTAEQKARFARMDFDRFLGSQAAEEVLTRLDLLNIVEVVTNTPVTLPQLDFEPEPAEETNTLTVADAPPAPAGPAEGSTAPPRNGSGHGPAAATGAPAVTAPSAAESWKRSLEDLPVTPTLPAALLQPVAIDFARYADPALLGDGEAKQKLRKFEDDLMVGRRELEQARANREGTKRLFDRGFVTRIDMERDDIALTNSLLKVQTATTARELFMKYEFPKLAEQSLSAFLESVRDLDRSRKAAVSRLAQAAARLKSAQAQFNIQLRRRRDLLDQLDRCAIKARRPGLVVYGGGEENAWRGEEQVREGATVRERQSIITIPDMTKMAVRVKIHESYIKKVVRDQKARVTVDAFPDQVLSGEVTYVGVLPDSANRWMSPDTKVYRTTIAIAGTHEWLKPGMSAKVEIQVDRLPDVLYVPIQAVVPHEGRQVCFIAAGGSPETREVETGQFNDSFIEIRKGLREGEKVHLRPPPGFTRDEKPADSAPGKKPPAEPRPKGGESRTAAPGTAR